MKVMQIIGVLLLIGGMAAEMKAAQEQLVCTIPEYSSTPVAMLQGAVVTAACFALREWRAGRSIFDCIRNGGGRCAGVMGAGVLLGLVVRHLDSVLEPYVPCY